MANRGFVFPGQGSQHIGMGVNAIADRPRVARVLGQIETLTGHGFVDVMLRGPEAKLRNTVLAQLSVFGLSVALWRALADGGIRPMVVAGHSLGEFSALVAGGWLDLDAAAVTVATRAEAMARCCQRNPGAMTAVLGVDTASLERALAATGTTVVVATVNAPRQAVVSGDTRSLAALELAITEEGIGTVTRLPVAGAFHSPLMRPAEQELAPIISELPLRRGHTPLISSVTGTLVTDTERYRDLLAGQITAPVRWADTVRRLLAHPVDVLVEVGPGTVLRDLIRKLDRRCEVRRCANSADLDALGLGAGQDEVSLAV